MNECERCRDLLGVSDPKIMRVYKDAILKMEGMKQFIADAFAWFDKHHMEEYTYQEHAEHYLSKETLTETDRTRRNR